MFSVVQLTVAVVLPIGSVLMFLIIGPSLVVKVVGPSIVASLPQEVRERT